MIKKLGFCLLACFSLLGCQSSSEETRFSFSNDLAFIEKAGCIEIDLENSSQEVQDKHKELKAILNDKEMLDDIAAMTTTTANTLETLGIQVTAAPDSDALTTTLREKQYTLSSNQAIDKSRILNLGSALSPNIEATIELNPKLALYSSAMPTAQYMGTLKDVGMNIHPLGQSDYMDMFILIDVINELENYENKENVKLMEDMVNALKEVQIILDAQAGNKKPRVAILQVAGTTVLSNDQESVLGKIVDALGMENVFKSSGNAEVNIEEIIAQDPDYILYFTHGNDTAVLEGFKETIYSEDSAYRVLSAIKNERALAVADDDFIFAASVDLQIVKVIQYLAKNVYDEK